VVEVVVEEVVNADADVEEADEDDTAGENGLLDAPEEVGVSGPEANAAFKVAANDARTNADVPEGVVVEVGGADVHADANADAGALDTVAAGLDGALDAADASGLAAAAAAAAGWKERIHPRGLTNPEADPAGDPAAPRLFHGREETCNETGRSTPDLLLRPSPDEASCG